MNLPLLHDFFVSRWHALGYRDDKEQAYVKARRMCEPSQRKARCPVGRHELLIHVHL